MIRTISGTLTIPASEVNAGGVYTDLTLQLVHVTGGVETLGQTSTVSTSKTYSFNYDDTGLDFVVVRLRRTSNGVLLAQSNSRGVLPRSFLNPPTDTFYIQTKHDNWLFDAGLSVLAATEGDKSLAKEITEGIIQAETAEGALPFVANHVVPTGATKEYRTGTIAMVAYSLGYYLEHYATASNKQPVAETLNNLLEWLCAQRDLEAHGGLLKGGVGRWVGSSFDASYVDATAYTADNILAYFAFKQAAAVLNEVYEEVADHLAEAIESKLFDASFKKFHKARTVTGAPNTADDLEVNYLGALFFMQEEIYGYAIYLMERVEAQFTQTDSTINVDAYKATTTDSVVSFEDSYGVAIAYYKLGDTAKYNKIIKSLNKLLNEDGSFRWGKIKDGQQKVLEYKSVGATALSYVANMVPEKVFTINADAAKVTGVVPVYINHTLEVEVQKNDCTEGTGSTVTYLVLPGTYNATADQDTADQLAQLDADLNKQAYANLKGTCSVPFAYTSSARSGWFLKEDCGPGSTGVPIEYTVPDGAYGSNISQDHADALRDSKLYKEGPIVAANSWECQVLPQNVWITPSTETISDTGMDEVYCTMYADRAVATFLTIEYEYTADGGSTWNSGNTITMYAGASNTTSFLVATTPWGGSDGVLVRITNVTPGTFGSQVYTWPGSLGTTFQNVELRGKFLKTCAGQNPVVVEYVVAAGTVSSPIDQTHADALAHMLIANNGFNYAESTGVCPGTLVGNDRQAQSFQKQGCGAGYEGEWKEYVVEAGTYLAASKTEANQLALNDITMNGQTWVNNSAGCILAGGTIQIWMDMRVDAYGRYDRVFFRAVASAPVTTDIQVQYDYNYNGTGHIGGFTTIYSGETSSAEDYGTEVAPGEGWNLQPYIISVTPETDGTTTYIF